MESDSHEIGPRLNRGRICEFIGGRRPALYPLRTDFASASARPRLATSPASPHWEGSSQWPPWRLFWDPLFSLLSLALSFFSYCDAVVVAYSLPAELSEPTFSFRLGSVPRVPFASLSLQLCVLTCTEPDYISSHTYSRRWPSILFS